jgi:hypothetical protein
MSVTLAQASTIIDVALNEARELKQMTQTANDDGARGVETEFSHRHRGGEQGVAGAESGRRADHDVGDAALGGAGIEAAALKTNSDRSKK